MAKSSTEIEKTLKQIDSEIDLLQKKIQMCVRIERAYTEVYGNTSGAEFDLMVMRRNAHETQLFNVQAFRKDFINSTL